MPNVMLPTHPKKKSVLENRDNSRERQGDREARSVVHTAKSCMRNAFLDCEFPVVNKSTRTQHNFYVKQTIFGCDELDTGT